MYRSKPYWYQSRIKCPFGKSFSPILCLISAWPPTSAHCNLRLCQRWIFLSVMSDLAPCFHPWLITTPFCRRNVGSGTACFPLRLFSSSASSLCSLQLETLGKKKKHWNSVGTQHQIPRKWPMERDCGSNGRNQGLLCSIVFTTSPQHKHTLRWPAVVGSDLTSGLWPYNEGQAGCVTHH